MNWQNFFMYSGVIVWLILAVIAVFLFFSECVSFNAFRVRPEDDEDKIKWFFNFSIFGFGPALVQHKSMEALEEFKKNFARHGFAYTTHKTLLIGLDYPKWINRLVVKWLDRKVKNDS